MREEKREKKKLRIEENERKIPCGYCNYASTLEVVIHHRNNPIGVNVDRWTWRCEKKNPQYLKIKQSKKTKTNEKIKLDNTCSEDFELSFHMRVKIICLCVLVKCICKSTKLNRRTKWHSQNVWKFTVIWIFCHSSI